MASEEQKKRLLELCELLESGEYKQTTKQLRSDDAFCCLGVACDKYINDTGCDGWKIGDGYEKYTFDGNADLLPPHVLNYYGLVNGGWHPDTKKNDQRRLSSMNDKGATFKEISAFIKEYCLDE